MKRETCTDEYIHRQQEFTLFIDIKNTRRVRAFVQSYRPRVLDGTGSTSFDKDGTSPVGYEPKTTNCATNDIAQRAFLKDRTAYIHGGF